MYSGRYTKKDLINMGEEIKIMAMTTKVILNIEMRGIRYAYSNLTDSEKEELSKLGKDSSVLLKDKESQYDEDMKNIDSSLKNVEKGLNIANGMNENE
jgi:hypothetical protein